MTATRAFRSLEEISSRGAHQPVKRGATQPLRHDCGQHYRARLDRESATTLQEPGPTLPAEMEA
jgi:hypothetical protein